MSTIVAQICIRRDTAANFTSANPTLALGEIAYETDTRNIKVGDGATAWTALGYINPYRGGTAAAPTSNTVIGSGAGAALQSGAEDNVLIGAGSGNNITTGDGNVFIGKDVGNQTTGSNSVAIGFEAMAAAGTTAFNSVGVGYRALWQATGGSNVAVGLNAATASGGFGSVTAVGNNAATLNTSSDITAIGANALDANTTGSANTAVGKDALGANTTGGSNTAVGWLAMDGNTVGSQNTAVGTTSLLNQTTGIRNSVLGVNAGRWRGSGTDTLTVANNSVFIGFQSRAAGDSETNQVVIAGVDGLGNGSNTTTIGNSSTTATHLNGPSTFSTGANGQSTRLGQSTTLLSGLSGATVTATSLIPANCILLGVTARVTTAVTGATTFDIGDGTTANRFGDDIAIALNTTANNCIAPALISAATNVVLTANGSNFTGGAVRLTAHFMTLVAPTS